MTIEEASESLNRMYRVQLCSYVDSNLDFITLSENKKLALSGGWPSEPERVAPRAGKKCASDTEKNRERPDQLIVFCCFRFCCATQKTTLFLIPLHNAPPLLLPSNRKCSLSGCRASARATDYKNPGACSTSVRPATRL